MLGMSPYHSRSLRTPSKSPRSPSGVPLPDSVGKSSSPRAGRFTSLSGALHSISPNIRNAQDTDNEDNEELVDLMSQVKDVSDDTTAAKATEHNGTSILPALPSASNSAHSPTKSDKSQQHGSPPISSKASSAGANNAIPDPQDTPRVATRKKQSKETMTESFQSGCFGSAPLGVRSMFVYTPVFTPLLNKHLPWNQLEVALRKKVNAQLTTRRNVFSLGNTAYISTEDLHLDERMYQSFIFSPEQLESSNHVLASAEEYQRYHLGRKTDGTTQWKMLHVTGPVLAKTVFVNDPDDLDHEKVKAQFRNAAQIKGLPPAFAVWYQKKEIDFDDVPSLLTSDGEQRILHLLQAFAAGELTKKVLEAGLNPLGQHGNRVYFEATKLSAGVDLMGGMEASLSFGVDKEPMLTWRPCQTHFLQETLLSEFLLAYGGSVFAGPAKQIPAMRFKHVKRALKGVRVAVAVKAGSKKSVFTIKDLGRSARATPQSVIGTVLEGSLTSLRHPDMLCINVASASKPFYFPPELCKILPEQPMKGELLVDELATAFRTARILTEKKRLRFKELPDPKDIFPKVSKDTFALSFIRITKAVDTSQVVQKPGDNAWYAFRQQVGERFNSKLESTVATAKSRDVTYDGHQGNVLANIAATVPDKANVTSVLMISVPKSLPRAVTKGLKKFCDTKLGVQCNFVNAEEIQLRYHPLLQNSMVQYSGQVVRKIFSRALYQPALDCAANGLHSDLLLGVHVVCLKDVIGRDAFDGKPLQLQTMHLVSIVSATSAVTERVNSTYCICHDNGTHDGPDHGSLALQIAECITKHVAGGPEWSRAAVILTGLSVKQKDSIDTIFDRIAVSDQLPGAIEPAELTFVALSPETGVSLCQDDHLLHLTDINKELGLPDDPQIYDAATRRGISNQLHEALDLQISALCGVTLHDKYRRHESKPTESSKLWHVVYKQIMTNDEISQIVQVPAAKEKRHVSLACLEKRVMPNISYLARQASKRACLRLKKKEAGDSAAECPYVVTPVPKSLERSLYFL